MAEIKEIPEDFVVTELGSPQPTGSGPYAYFVLHKRGWNTLDALETIAAKLGLPLIEFGWAGNKDKQAITEQVCSAKGASRERLEALRIDGITLTYLGQAGRPIGIGTHEGNRFKITIRDLDNPVEIRPRFVNLFGEQRLGGHNAVVGRELIKKNFKAAAENILTDSHRGKRIRNHLEKRPNDVIGGLNTVPSKLLTFYIHAYQSSLWNAAAIKIAGRHGEQVELPLIGFGTAQEDIEKYPEITEQMKLEGITPRDFIIRQLPDLSAEGGSRQLWCEASNLNVSSPLDDDRHPDKSKIVVEFELPKGSYATELLRQSLA